MKDDGAPKQVAVILGERVYGSEESLGQVFVQEVPEVFRELAVDLRQRSALLALADTPGIEKRSIFEAYGKDLGLLKRRLAEFEACVLQAIRSSIICKREGAEKPETVWQVLKEQVPAIGRAPLLDLPHTRAAQPAPELLAYLKTEFEEGVWRVLRLMACWLQLLVEAEFVGLVEWAGLDVCRYHFFRHERTKEVLAERTRSETSVDESQPVGQRTTYRELVDRVIRRREFRERHVHDIVEAKLHSVAAFPHRVPSRIAEFLDAVPAWLRPLLQIVEGSITREEIVRRTTSDATTVEPHVISEWKGSPGVLLGPFNFIGWSADDLGEGPGVRYYEGQAARRLTWPKVRARFWWFALAAVGVSLLATGIGWLIWYVSVGEPRARAEAHTAYVSQFSPAQVVETRKGEQLPLPAGADVRYAGVGISNNANRMYLVRGVATGEEVRLPWLGVRGFELTSGKDRFLFGNADLGKEFGVFVKLHVLSAEEGVVRYIVTTYGK